MERIALYADRVDQVYKLWLQYHGHVHKRNRVLYYYYEDSEFGLHGNSVCSQSMILRNSIESFTKKQILQRILPALDFNELQREVEARLSQETDYDDQEQNLQRQVASVDRKLDNIRNAVTEGIDPKFFKAKICVLKTQKAALREELAALQRTDTPKISPDEIVDEVMSIARGIPTALDAASPKKINELFKHFVNRIEVDGKQRIAKCYLYRIPRINVNGGAFIGKRMPEVGHKPRL